MKSYFRILLVLLATLLLLCGCGRKLTVNDDDTYTDRRSGVTYAPLSPCYEPAAIGAEYATYKLSGMKTVLYQVGTLEPEQYLTSEYYAVYANRELNVPDFAALTLTKALLYKTTNAAIPALTLKSEDDAQKSVITALRQAYLEGARVSYPSFYEREASYTLRFEASNLPGLYYTVTYIEYAEDITDEIDGVPTNLGRYFLYDRYNQICVAVDDALHALLKSANAAA